MYGYNYENLNNENQSSNKENGSKLFYIIVILIFIVLLGILLYKLFVKSEKKYQDIERKLIEAATIYVINNNIAVND